MVGWGGDRGEFSKDSAPKQSAKDVSTVGGG